MHFLVKSVLFVALFQLLKAEEEWVDNPEVELPPSMIICKRYDPDRDECIKRSINSLLPNIMGGYEPLQMEIMDPYVLKSFNFSYQTGGLSLRMYAKTATTHGIRNTKVRKVRSKVDDKSMHLELFLYHPQLVVETNYKGEGSFNDLRVKPQGYANTTLTGISAIWIMDGEIETRNGEEYMKIKSFDAKPRIKGFKMYATGLFPDPDLNQIALEFLNQYWDRLYDQMFPQTRQIWEPIALNGINKIFGRVPFRRLMPKE